MSVWSLLESTFPILLEHMHRAHRTLPSLPINDPVTWERLEDFYLFDHTPINGARVTDEFSRRRYMSADYLDSCYEQLVEEGYATQKGDMFSLAPCGRALYQQMLDTKAKAYASVDLLCEEKFANLVRFLQKGYAAALKTDFLHHKPSLSHGYRYYMNFEGGQLGDLWRYINLFELYRDDVHFASWKMMGFSAIEIETLTYLWREGEQTAGTLAEMLAHRGYDADDYAFTLDELRWLGYVMPSGDLSYVLTLDGRHVRSGIEAETDIQFERFCCATFSDEDMVNFSEAVHALRLNPSTLTQE
ncbi:MAG: hypothetical protein AAFR81_23255 [Chloroflexota bacterium]